MNPITPNDLVTFLTPKGRELTGRVFLRGDRLLAVAVSLPKVTTLVDEKDVVSVQPAPHEQPAS